MTEEDLKNKNMNSIRAKFSLSKACYIFYKSSLIYSMYYFLKSAEKRQNYMIIVEWDSRWKILKFIRFCEEIITWANWIQIFRISMPTLYFKHLRLLSQCIIFQSQLKNVKIICSSWNENNRGNFLDFI